VGALGVVELRPQLEVTPQQLSLSNQPFSVPFNIKNSGYLSFFVDHVICFIVNTETIQGAHFAGIIFQHPDWDGVTLDRGISGTMSCSMYGQDIGGAHGHGDTPKSADIVMAVTYRPWQGFPYLFRKHFGFRGLHGDTWQWTSYPPSQQLKDKIDAEINSKLRVN